MLIKPGLILLLLIHGTSSEGPHFGSHGDNGEGDGENGPHERHDRDGNGDMSPTYQSHKSQIIKTTAALTTSQAVSHEKTTHPFTKAKSTTTQTTTVPPTNKPFQIPSHFSPNHISKFQKRLRSFAAELYHQILTITPKDQNIFFSPYSISHSLAMINAGARGNSSSQIRNTMKIEYSPEVEIDPMIKVIMDDKFSMKSKSDVIAQMTVRSFIQEKFSVKKDYIERLKFYYNSGIESMNFSETLVSKERINNWVEENTNNLIEDLIPDGVITPLTRLVLVNTLYFKAPWTTKFTELKSRTFQSPTGAVEVPYIYNKSQFKVFENTNTMYVAVPYSDGSTYFVIAMPKNDKASKKFEAKLNIKWYFLNLQKRLKEWKTRKVTLYIPKFTVEQSLDMAVVLKAMGLVDIFSQTKADLGGVSSTYLYVSDFLHKARITVNKEGTEAAAASASFMSSRSLSKPIMIDRPFLFAVFEDDGDILFTGKVVNPSS